MADPELPLARGAPEAPLSAATLAHDLRGLLREVHADGDEDVRPDLDDLLRRGLDWVARLAPYDLAAVFALHGGALELRAMRGALASPALRHHTLDLRRFPTIREALETRRARAYTEQDHAHGDGDPFDGVLDLPHGHSCMVVPLCAGDRCYGVLTLDRTRCETYAPAVVDMVEVYGHVLALAIAAAEQRGQLERTLGREREASRLLAARTVGDRPGVLEDSASPTVRELAARARQVAVTDTPVLLLGDTGTGKERLARAIHGWSRRASGPFVAINCAAIPATLIESELFGHVRGAFSGATKDRSGRFRVADGGTLLLDEIGELPLELQAKLLRVLQEGTFEPVGSDRGVRADVRVIAATHVDLREAASAGRFRPDLLYRLDVFPLRLPPLRERLEDLPALVEVMLAEQSQRTGRVGLRVDGEGFARLRRHGWPGNLRELANVLERASILLPPGAPAVLDGAAIERAMPVLAALAGPLPGDDEPPPTLDEIQRRHILAVLRRTGGRLYGEGGAAELLGLRPSTLQSRMKKLGLARKAALAGG